MTGAELIHALPAFVDLLSLVLLAGTASSLAFVLPPGDITGTERIRPSLFRWTLFAIFLSWIAAPFVLVQKTLEMSAQGMSELHTLILTMLSGTHYGLVWSLWIGTLAVLGVMAWNYNRAKRIWPFIVSICVGILVLAWIHSASGHAADGGDFTFKQCIDGLHILSGSVWLGALSVFILAVAPKLPGTPEGEASFVILLQRLSRLALVAFILVLGSGLYNLEQHIGSLAMLWQRLYGETLTLKLALVAGMLIPAAVTRFYALPRLRHKGNLRLEDRDGGRASVTATGPGRAHLLHQVKRLLLLESSIGILVVCLVALLTHEMPPV